MTDTWQTRALLLIARTLLRCERHLLRLDRDGQLGIKTKQAVLMANDESIRYDALAKEVAA